MVADADAQYFDQPIEERNEEEEGVWRMAYGKVNAIEVAHCKDGLLAIESRRLINEAVSALSPRQQQAYCLHQYMSNSEVAKVLAISVDTASYHVKHAKSNVKKRVMDQLGISLRRA